MSNTALQRLRKEFKKLQKEPVPNIEAVPRESNMLEWNYCITGPKDSPYEGGFYHGKLKFPANYPYKPPSIYMCTPSGRFQINKRLCLSMSDFHPETWNPLWSVSSILSGLLSFMLEDKPTYGSIETSTDEKIRLAKYSLDFNMKSAVFRECFPHYIDMYAKLNMERAARAKALSDRVKQNGEATKNSGMDTKVARPDDLWDKMIICIVISTIVFIISYLYK